MSVELGVLESSMTRSSASLVGIDATGGDFRLVVGKRGRGVDASSSRLRLSSSEAEGFLSSDTVESPLDVELGDPCWCLVGESMPMCLPLYSPWPSFWLLSLLYVSVCVLSC